MLDRLYLPFLALAAVGAVALALAWPQGLGDRAPDPFGSTPLQRTPAMQAQMKRANDAAQRHAAQGRDALRKAQGQALDPSQ